MKTPLFVTSALSVIWLNSPAALAQTIGDLRSELIDINSDEGEAHAPGEDAIAIGKNALASKEGAIAIGTDAEAEANDSVAIGTDSHVGVGADIGTALGYQAEVDGYAFAGTAIGAVSDANANYATALGA